VIAKYLSMLMAHNDKIEAVQRRMSREIHISHNTNPNRHLLSENVTKPSSSNDQNHHHPSRGLPELDGSDKITM
jgi:hypothetical protein